jgi:hypothetical protein
VEAEAGGLQIQGQLGPHIKIMSPKKNLRKEGRRDGVREGGKEQKKNIYLIL